MTCEATSDQFPRPKESQPLEVGPGGGILSLLSGPSQVPAEGGGDGEPGRGEGGGQLRGLLQVQGLPSGPPNPPILVFRRSDTSGSSTVRSWRTR